MAGNKKQLLWWSIIGVLILMVPVFWHYKAQNPFLYSKELLVKSFVPLALAAAIWQFNKFFSVFIIYCMISSFMRLSSRNLWALGNIRDFFTYYLLFRIMVKKEHVKYVLWLWLVALILPFCIAWLQYFRVDPLQLTSPLFRGVFQGDTWRVAGFFGNTHLINSWLGLCSPLAFLLPAWLAIIVVVLIACSLLFFSISYGGFLLCILSSSVTLYLMKFKRNIAIFSLIFSIILAGGIITGINKNHAEIRIETIKNTLPFLKAHPFKGYGLNSFGEANIHSRSTYQAQAHNEFLQAYFEFGGVVFWLLIIPFVIYYIKKIKSIASTRKGSILGGLFTGFILYSQYGFPFHLAYSALFFLTIIASCDTLTSN